MLKYHRNTQNVTRNIGEMLEGHGTSGFELI